MPDSTPVIAFSLGGLGKDLEQREWQMISSKYHSIYFQESSDRAKVHAVFQLIDNVYDFLSAITPVKDNTPIQVYLAPGEKGNSRRATDVNGIRTGADAEVAVIIGTILHEETHLFNNALLEYSTANWWAGEFTAFYFQMRALQHVSGGDVRDFIRKSTPQGPTISILSLDRVGQPAIATAFTVLYFLEETYGREPLDAFRRAMIKSSHHTADRSLAAAGFEKSFGDKMPEIERKWRAFYGWPEPAETPLKVEGASPQTSELLAQPVSYATRKASIQDIVRNIVKLVGLRYDFDTSAKLADPERRAYVTDFSISQVSCREALNHLLKPRGLDYRLEGDAVVLFRRK